MEPVHDESDWSAWFRQHGHRLLLCARQFTRSLADAEDVLQDAFIRFWRHQRELPGDPVAMVVTSLRRSAVDLARREGRRQRREAISQAHSDEAYFEPLDQGDDRRQAIEAALRALPDEQRKVLVLKIWGELTFDQISAELNISANTAASRYRYALAALRKELCPAEMS